MVTVLSRTWFTGLLYILAGFGWLFYLFLWVIRAMQRFFLIVVIACLAMAGLGVYWFVPSLPQGAPVEFSVGPGEPVRSVAVRLKQQRIVPAVTPFLLWMRISGTGRKMQAGRFVLCAHEGVFSVVKKLPNAMPEDLAVVFPEGLTVEETASRVQNALGIDSVAFVRACNNPAFARAIGIDAPSLEGYLFPQTYRVAKGTPPETLIVRMVMQFNREYVRLAVSPEAARLSRHQIVTLASIVEKEAVLPDERTRIAGVFWNRLRTGEPLGADPTVRYIFRKFSGPLLVSELRADNPYNTRMRAGLPPGPICSPGAGALQAAVQPMKTSELYFVARWDGTGAHDFSVTAAQHNRKKMRIRRENEIRNRDALNQKAHQ